MAEFYAWCKAKPRGQGNEHLEPDAAWKNQNIAAVKIVDLDRFGGSVWHCQGTKPAAAEAWKVDDDPPPTLMKAIWKAIKDSHEFAR
jgi:hypothetical protein